MPQNTTIRLATADDLDLIARLMVAGFGGDEAERRIAIANNPRFSYRDSVIAEIEGTPVGKATAFPTQMWLSGVPISMGAVAGVMTLPEYRNRGVASAMMQRLLEKMYQEDITISVLFPAVYGLYYGCGYADIATWHAYSIKPDNLPTYNEGSNVRAFTLDDLAMVKSVYRGGQLSQADGRLTRSGAWWDHLVAEAHRTGNRHIVVYEGELGVEGYLKYVINEDQILRVNEMFVSSDAAYRGLWSYMASQPDIASIDYIAPADDPIHHMLKRPQDSHGGNRGWIFNDIYHATSTILLRVINVVEALTARFYPHDMMGNRIFKISDPQLPQNQELINFRIVDGRPDIIPVNGQAPDIETDIATFSQIYGGFLSAEMARRLGRLSADDETVVWLTKAMATNPIFMHTGDWF